MRFARAVPSSSSASRSRAFSADSAALTALRNSESDNFPSSSLWHSIDSSKSIGWGRSIVKVPNNKEPKH